MKSSAKPRHFVDHAATTPLRPGARAATVGNLDLVNPSEQCVAAHVTKKVLEESHEETAELLGADSTEVVLTSDGTEADNLTIFGLYFKATGSDIMVSLIEHNVVLKMCRHLEKEH